MTIDLLLTKLQLKLPNHTYQAVKANAELRDEPERTQYLERILKDREQSEGVGE